MEVNPAQDWQRLTEHYREMSDGELEELAADFIDLTPTAQQVLSNEMRSRSLAMPRPDRGTPKRPDLAGAPQLETDSRWTAGPRLALASPWGIAENPKIVDDEPSPIRANSIDDFPHDYTWKTILRECDDRVQASQIAEVLKRAGIESWIEQPGSRYSMDIGSPRILVAADQLEEARAIAARPIPQDIVDQSKIEVPEFVPPKCPKCGAGDPVLEGVDPTNSWRCEACGRQWTESAEALPGSMTGRQ
jgi:ribosomal protein L37AE/L43A